MSKEFYREIHKSARRGTDQIEHCKCLIEKRIEKDKTALLMKRRDGSVSDASVSGFWDHLGITLGNTFRYTLLSGVCAVVQECVDAISEKIIPVEDARKRALTKAVKAVKARKRQTNWLETGVELISTEANIRVPGTFQSDVSQFTDIITLRNCISHVWGNVPMADYPDQVREAVKRMKIAEKKENTELTRISDGRLALGRDMVSHAVCLAVEIVNYLCTVMVRVA